MYLFLSDIFCKDNSVTGLSIFLIEIIALFLISCLIIYLDLQTTKKIHFFLTSHPSIVSSMRRFITRFVEIVISAQTIIILAPSIIFISILIKKGSPGPIFYKQIYSGAYGKKFKAYKFRTMVQNADKIINRLQDHNLLESPAFYAKDDPRLTSLGRFLRNKGFDELPLLINVLKGDMSLVGPKLITAKENKIWNLYTETTSVKPGFIDIGYADRYTLFQYTSFRTFPYIYTLEKHIIVNNKKRLAKDQLYIKNPRRGVSMRVFLDFLRIEPARIFSKIEPVFIKK